VSTNWPGVAWTVAAVLGCGLIAAAWRRDRSPLTYSIRWAVGSAAIALVPAVFRWGWTAAMLILAYVTWAVLLASLGHPARFVDVELLNSGEPSIDPWEEAQRRAGRRRLYSLLAVTTIGLVVWGVTQTWAA